MDETGMSPPPEVQVKIEAPGPDDEKKLAKKEAAAIGAGRDLSKEEIENEHDRRERLRNTVHWATCAIVWGALGSFCIGALVVFIHMIVPQWGWLPPEQLAQIKAIGGSALVAAVLTQLGKQLLAKL